MVLALYYLAAAGLVNPQIYSLTPPGSSLHVSAVSRILVIMVPAMALYLSPYILFPCLFDRFPNWLVRHTKPDHLRSMAKSFFGVDIRA